MTKAEAIAMLKRIQEPEAWEPQINQAAFEALDMAIKALEQQPCEDTISRQAAIDALDVLCQEHRYKIPGKRETYSQYNEAWQDALDRAEGAIFNLPSAQPEQQWIPCSERLPEHGGRYLISVLDGINRRTTVAPYLPRCKAWAMNGRMAYWKVIAWLPLPEPYREEEQDG